MVLATSESSIQALFGLKRDLVDLRRRVAPLRDVMQRLGSHGVLYVEHEAEVYFRDVHDDVMRQRHQLVEEVVVRSGQLSNSAAARSKAERR